MDNNYNYKTKQNFVQTSVLRINKNCRYMLYVNGTKGWCRPRVIDCVKSVVQHRTKS